MIEKNAEYKVTIEGANGNELLNNLIMADILPDVCLIDLNMPVMNGFELLNQIRKRWPQLPCIILSAFSDEYYILQLIMRGANGYLFKTCEPEEITAAIQAVITKGYYYNDMIASNMVTNIVNIKKKKPELNDRERELLKYICSDLSYAEIAIKMGTTFKTVDGIRMRLCVKLRINSRIGLVLAAIRLGYYTVQSEEHLKDLNFIHRD